LEVRDDGEIKAPPSASAQMVVSVGELPPSPSRFCRRESEIVQCFQCLGRWHRRRNHDRDRRRRFSSPARQGRQSRFGFGSKLEPRSSSAARCSAIGTDSASRRRTRWNRPTRAGSAGSSLERPCFVIAPSRDQGAHRPADWWPRPGSADRTARRVSRARRRHPRWSRCINVRCDIRWRGR
jgi:hypothetical protein